MFEVTFFVGVRSYFTSRYNSRAFHFLKSYQFVPSTFNKYIQVQELLFPFEKKDI